MRASFSMFVKVDSSMCVHRLQYLRIGHRMCE